MKSRVESGSRMLAAVCLTVLVAACSGETTSSSPSNLPGDDAAPDQATVDTGMEASGGSAGEASLGEDSAHETADGPASARGTCATASDCSGQPCVLVADTADGWHTCSSEPSQKTQCASQGQDQCCTSADCKDGGSGGGCFSSTLFYCGGAAPQEYNVCIYPSCKTSADCSAKPHGVCVPAGAFGEPSSVCVYDGDCVLDSECTSRADGRCMPFFDPCAHRFIGFNCTYADSACRRDADCTGGSSYCAPGKDGNTKCDTFYPPP